MKLKKPKLEDVKEDRIRELVRYLICKKTGLIYSTYSRSELTFEIIKLIKCDVSDIDSVFSIMHRLGLHICIDLCSPFNIDGSTNYNIIKFAQMRGYVTDEEVEDFHRRKWAYDYPDEEDLK